jgi:hypothetical protein
MAASVELTGCVRRSNGMLSSAPQWPPRAGYYTPAKMPLNVISPRPDAETNTYARHRWAHSQMMYEVPIGVSGGAWPYRYEVISGPAWLNVGKFYGDSQYGILHGTPNATGSYPVTVRVTSADGINYIDVQFTVQSDIGNAAIVDAQFVFVQDGYAGTKVGTISQPLAGFTDWWGASVSDAAYHNKIIVWRAGEYAIVPNPAENNGNLRLQASTKTCQHIGFPGEEPIWDMTAAKVLDDISGSNDLFVTGITFTDARNDVPDAHYFWITAETNRATWWKNKFKDILHGTDGTDNTGPIFIGTTATIKNYICIQDNVCENVINGGFNGTYFTIFRASNVLIHNNTAKNCTTGTGINAKGTVANVTIRANQLWDNVTGIQIGIGYGQEALEVPHDHEICWNNAKCPGNVIQFINSNYYAGQTYNTYLYRNTLQGASGTCQFVGVENFETDANILNFGSYANWNESIQTSVVANIKTTAVNAAGELTSALGFGTHGWRPY